MALVEGMSNLLYIKRCFSYVMGIGIGGSILWKNHSFVSPKKSKKWASEEFVLQFSIVS